MNIAIIGRNQILYDTAVYLNKMGHDIKCIVTAKPSSEYTRNEKDFKKLAKNLKCKFFLTSTLDNPEITACLQGLDIGVSINWISVIKKRHIDLFSLGILNAHHGNLPGYRGNATSNWAILNHEKTITNTIHLMEGAKLDSGPIICQSHFELDENTDITDIYYWSQRTTKKLFAKALELLTTNPNFITRYADANSPDSFRCYPRIPQDNLIKWDNHVSEIHALIRASGAPFDGAYTFHFHRNTLKKLHILKSRIVSHTSKDIAVPGHVIENNKNSGESLIHCKEGILSITKCKYSDEKRSFLPGKRWKSIRIRLGINTEDLVWLAYQP